MKVFLMVLMLVTSACASMQDKAFKKVPEGSTEEVLVNTLGSPTFFLRSISMPGSQAYYYQKSGYICSFTIKDKIVHRRSCVVDNDPKATAGDAQRIGNALAIEERNINFLNMGKAQQAEKKVSDFDPDQYLREKAQLGVGQ